MHRNLILFLSITIYFLASCEKGFDLNSGITISEENELYTLELNVSSNVTTDVSPVQFNAKVIRHSPYQFRPDSRFIGYWSIFSLNIDGESNNIAQYPIDYEFYTDQSFDKIEWSTLGGDTQYSNGGWTADMDSGTLTMSLQGETTAINVTFDNNGPIVPLDGYMIWNFEKDGKTYHQVMQKSEYTDPTELEESISYLSIESTGGTIGGTTEPSTYDISINLPNEVGAFYEVSGTFIPLYEFSNGYILATLFSEQNTVLNINIPISIEYTY